MFSPATSCFRPSWAANFKHTLSRYLYLSSPPLSKKGAKYYCSPCWACVSSLCAFFCFIPSSVFSLAADRKYTGVWSIISASAPGSNQYQNKLLHKATQTPSHLTRQTVNSRREEAYICQNTLTRRDNEIYVSRICAHSPGFVVFNSYYFTNQFNSACTSLAKTGVFNLFRCMSHFKRGHVMRNQILNQRVKHRLKNCHVLLNWLFHWLYIYMVCVFVSLPSSLHN